jgi:uncharacterized protein YegP (UPF0339 family)
MGITGISKAQDEKFKAIFVYNFTKYINWPLYQGNFIICVIGNSPIIGEIEGIASKKTVGNSAIEIVKVNSADEIAKCHIVYVTASKSSLVAQLFQKAKESNILVISEKQNACASGAGINFVSNNGKLIFEISKSNIESCGLKVSTDLLKLGTSVNN